MWNLKSKTNKKPSSLIQRTDQWLAEVGGGVGEVGEGHQKVQTSRYKINVTCHGDVMYSMVTITNNNCISYFKVAKRVDLKSSNHKKINFFVTVC